jgi:hypothetical protein
MADEEVDGSVRRTLVSGLAIPFAIPPALEAVRRRWDRAASAGAEAHVTILYPFLPCATLGRPVRTELAAIARRVAAFEVRFERVRRFDGLVWIEPDRPHGFVALTSAVVARWPNHQPYGGAFDEVIPHLTVVESEVAPFDIVAAVAQRAVPFSGRAERLELWCQDAAGRWRPRWRMPFAVRP